MLTVFEYRETVLLKTGNNVSFITYEKMSFHKTFPEYIGASFEKSVSLYELYYCIEKIKSICIIARKLMQKIVKNDKMNKNIQMMVDFYVRNDYNRIINKRKRFLPKKKKL